MESKQSKHNASGMEMKPEQSWKRQVVSRQVVSRTSLRGFSGSFSCQPYLIQFTTQLEFQIRAVTSVAPFDNFPRNEMSFTTPVCLVSEIAGKYHDASRRVSTEL
jgi:hypothetical protein